MSNVNLEFRHIFIHIPKCGGTSMERVPWVGGNGHRTAYQIFDACAGLHPWGMFKWAFVRHPVERFLSVHRAFASQGREICPPTDVNDWAKMLMLNPCQIYRFIHLVPQYHFVCFPPGNLAVDFIGKIENVAEDWATVKQRIGIVDEAPLPQLNATSREGWAKPNRWTLDWLREIYRRDFELFRYADEPDYCI